MKTTKMLIVMAFLLPAFRAWCGSLEVDNLTVTTNATIYGNLNFPTSTGGNTNTVAFKLWAGGGGGTDGSDGFGAGSGGFVSGTVYVADGSVLKVVVGAGGSAGANSRAGGGGGLCGVFLGTVSQANALLVAGAGSSGARSLWPGRGGGGCTGQDGEGDYGHGGSQVAGGAGGTGAYATGESGSALAGGKGGGPNASGGPVYGGGPDGGGDNGSGDVKGTTGAGGSGYFGGGGAGCNDAPNYGGSGGGGSSYTNSVNGAISLVGSNGLGGSAYGYLGGSAVNAGDEHYIAGIGKGGNGEGGASTKEAGGNGLCVYRINGGSWVTLYCITNDQTINVGQTSYSNTLTISSNGINQASASVVNKFMGKVGIGTNNPTEKLHVVGNVKVDGSLFLGGDSRSNWPSGAEGALMISNNLSEITGEGNKAAARSNLGIGSAATNETSAFLTPTSDGSQLTNITAAQVGALGTNVGTLIEANNLSELTDTAATARTNLGLGTAATNNTGDFLAPTGNGSQLTAITAAQTGALSTNGGTVGGNVSFNGLVSISGPVGDIPMGSYTNQ